MGSSAFCSSITVLSLIVSPDRPLAQFPGSFFRPSTQPVGFELPGCARDEDLEDGNHRYREQHSGEIEQNAAAHDPDYHHERMKFDRATEDERFVQTAL